MKQKTKSIVFCLALFSFLSVIVVSHNTSAASSSSISKKWISSIVYQCISDQSAVSPTVTRLGSTTVADKVMNPGSPLPLPSYGFYSSDTTMNCQNAYLKSLDYAGRDRNLTFAKLQETNTLLYDSGYKKPDGTETVLYVKGQAVLTKYKCYDTINCSDATQDGNATTSDIGSIAITLIDSGTGTLSISSASGYMEALLVGEANAKSHVRVSFSNSTKQLTFTNDFGGNSSESSVSITWGYGETAKDIQEKINQKLAATYWRTRFYPDDGIGFGGYTDVSYQFSANGATEAAEGKTFEYEDDRKTGANRFLSNISGYNGVSGLLLTTEERAELYTYYVNHAIPNDLQNRFTCEKVGDEYSNQEAVPLYSGGKWHTRWVDLSSVDTSKMVYDLYGGYEIREISIRDVISWLQSHGNVDEVDEECEELEDIQVNEGMYTPPVNRQEDTLCFDNAGAMGWIMCPILSALSNVTERIYNYIEDNFLQVSANDMLGDEVREVWGMVRDVANVAFIVMFLVVIFSQLTGYGIDNLGIKRMLPRLIVTAVLVNLSFIICQLLVDISNILGASLKSFLDGAVPAASSANAAVAGAGGIIELVASGVILTAVASFLNPGVILAFIMAILALVMSLLFMFVLLLARQIGIIIIIVLAPVAIICYMLPNTEQLFKSWRKIGVALLMAYPLCALAMGAGHLLSNLLSQIGTSNAEDGGSTIMLIGAMIVRVLPFFFIPTLLRRAMAGLGNVGGMISNLGQRASRGVQGAATGVIRRSGAYKNLESNFNEREAERTRNTERRRLERTVKGFDRKIGNRRPEDVLSKNQLLRRARAQAALNKMQTEDVNAEAGVQTIPRETELAQVLSQRSQQQSDAVKEALGMDAESNYGENMGVLQNRLKDAIAGGRVEEIRGLADHMSSKGDSGRTAVDAAMGEAISEAAMQGNEISNESFQAFSSIVAGNKYGQEYKNKARSTFDFAGAINNAQAGDGAPSIASQVGNITDYTGKISSLSQDKIVNADDKELKRYTEAVRSGKLSDNDFKQLYGMINSANKNVRIRNQMKGDTQKLVNEFLSASAGSGKYSGLVEVDVPRDDGSGNTNGGGI